MKTDKLPEVRKKAEQNNAKKRSLKWGKKRSMKKKKKEKERDYFRREDQILTSSIPHGTAANKSPHILINLWHSRMKKNTIILKNPIESGKGKCRKVFYEIESIGGNISLHEKKKYMNLRLHNTKLRWIMIVVRFEDVMSHQNLNFFTETGQLINENDLHLNKRGFVVLGTIQIEESFEKMPNLISGEDLKLAKKYCYNQTKNNSADYHFGTTGSIFSFGYGPRYKKNPLTQHSIDKFANSK